MSPLAEILLRRGITGQRVGLEGVFRDRTSGVPGTGISRRTRGRARRRRGCRGALVGGAAVEPGDPGSRAPRHPGDPARRAARRADGGESGRRRRRRARQDDDHGDARPGPRSRRTRSDGRDRRPLRARSAASARVGRSELLVAEADESDRSFLWLQPRVRDRDQHRSRASRELRHLRGPDAAPLRGSRNRVPADGAAVLCVDDRMCATAGRRRSPRRSSPTGSTTLARAIGATDVTRRGLRLAGDHRAADRRRAATRARDAPAPRARPAQRAQRARGDRRRQRTSASASRPSPRRWRSSVAPSADSSARARPTAAPSSTTTVITRPRSRRCCSAARATGAAPDPVRVSAASLFAHRAPAARLRSGACARRRDRAHRHLSGWRRPDARRDDRGAGRRGQASLWRAASTSSPRLDDVPAAVARWSRPGDLVITLGAGSIGTAGDRILEEMRACP